MSDKLGYSLQGIVDSSASKPTLVKDTNYMVEKTYHIVPYLGAFGAYLMTQKGVSAFRFRFCFYSTIKTQLATSGLIWKMSKNARIPCEFFPKIISYISIFFKQSDSIF